MKEITYSPHLEFRLKLRQIPRSLPLKIYQTSKEKYYDRLTNKSVAIQKVKFKGKMREMVVIYEGAKNRVTIVTIHPLKALQKLRRTNSGRWQKI